MIFRRNIIQSIILCLNTSLRHTWATIAFSIGIPEEIIAEALGHSHGNRTTAIYIDKSVANIDAANRKVLDYVLYKEQPKD